MVDFLSPPQQTFVILVYYLGGVETTKFALKIKFEFWVVFTG